MSEVKSKNLYELLANTSDDDPDKIPAPLTQPVDKAAQRKGKRDAPAESPREVPGAAAAAAARGGARGGRRGNLSGNEGAFRDRDAGRSNNRSRPTEEAGRGPRGPRGGRGAARPRPYDDRHSKGVGAGPNDHAKQAGHGWGEETGNAEWKDEQAGDAIAAREAKEGFDANVDKPVNADGETPADEPEPEPEPEDKTKSYVDYLAEQAQKKLQLGGGLTARKANEGSGKKLPEGKELARDEDADFFVGTGGKAKRERERKEKNVYVLDHDIQARERESSSRGGRGGRGGRGRGDGAFRGGDRGDRGERGGRGGREGSGRADFRGGRGGSGRADFRGARGGRGGASINVGDTSAFPSLGS